MDKRILESVKEFYKNVKGQEFFPDIIPYMEYSPDEQEYKNHFNF
ncbi:MULTISPECIES: hypothetical protein [Desulfitobacterium]|uniref:Uncharacterized protein n=1 Tax=Desulfitobacterium dehalogenans (strain ATCC 51507 / DSM 9161 / JW/IU-DC1) TaxID=756499 RepID=I4A8U3_DESDJ|nr:MULTISPECIES: hypothetical protein [Desulfitobacterium]AFM00378.1 hypothetical protein Desde_1991 [Desulfitobacterium dehalogenans ATCC 51507]